MQRRLLILVVLSIIGCIAVACSGDDEAPSTSGPGATTDEAPRTHGLTEEEAGQVLATIGDREITVGEFAESIASKGPFLRARYNSPERRRELLDQMVRFELFAQEADRRGLDDLPEVQRTRKQVLIRRFLKQEYEDRIQLSDVTDADVQAYFDSHQDEFNKPEQVRASHIVFSSQATAQRVLHQLTASPSDMRLFRQLAEVHNTDPATRDRFGDIGFFSRPAERQADEPELPPEVAEAAFSMDTIGTIYPELVHTSQGWHIVKITGRRAPLHRTLEEASRPIRHRLWRERREQAVEDLVARLRSEADVHEDLALLDQVHIDIPEGNFPTVEAEVGAPGATPSGAAPGGGPAPSPSPSGAAPPATPPAHTGMQ
ncbi:MAG: peptidylprolyl isomerase [Sandaracinaceae bacterium]|nr:peptidylprolyl isomerase [Sandaracinaceae bacterium]